MMSLTQLSLALALLVLASSQAKAEFPGFLSLYSSNRARFREAPISFEKDLPPEFAGHFFISNGLGAFEMGARRVQHAFDAFAKPMSVQFLTGSKGLFSFDFLQTDQWRRSLELNDVAPYLMFESVEPPFDLRQKMSALLAGLDNANVNIFKVGRPAAYLATSDYWRTWQVCPRNVTTLGKVDPPVPGAVLPFVSTISLAHPLPEYGTTNMITATSSALPMQPLGKFGRLRIQRIRSPNNRELITEWKVKKTPYMHSFVVTHNFSMLAAAPLTIDAMAMLKTVQPFKSLRWNPQDPGTLYVVNHRTGGQKMTIPYKDSTFIMHHINGYEKSPDHVVFYGTAYYDTKVFCGLEMKRLRNVSAAHDCKFKSHIRRYDVDLKAGTATSVVMKTNPKLPTLHNLEMPCINERYRFREFCFTYGVISEFDGKNFANSSLAKRSFCDVSEDKVWMEPYHYPAEPQFVPRMNSKSEDDGYLVSVVLDGPKKRSYFGIWDARTMELINKAYLPTIIPYRLHGHVFD